jgi:hypothetical protein
MTGERRPESGSATGEAPAEVTAVVLTHKRPSLAGDVARSLTGREGFRAQRVVVVVNGDGGLDDPDLQSRVRTVRLTTNLGPAGGFRAGMEEAFSDPSTRWAYLCEDDVGLFSLPSPRVSRLVRLVEAGDSSRVGAVVAYGRRFVGRGAHTLNTVPPEGVELAPVDVACWGATLVSRSVRDAGVLPDPAFFFGLEDFDFFCRVRAAGYTVLVDGEAARQVAAEQTLGGRHDALRLRRPTDLDEPWRAYYNARNSFELARRHGRASWHAWHLAYSARRIQLASGWAERRAILHGLWDGARGRLGEHPGYGRRVGELAPGDRSGGSPSPER